MTGRPRRAPANQHLEQLAHQIRLIAHQIPGALTHLQQELRQHDGYPAGSDTPGSSTLTTDTTSRSALQRHHLTQLHDDYRAWLVALEHEIRRGARIVDGILRTRPAAPEPTPTLCRDGVHGKDLSPTLTADIIQCWEHPHKSGLCNRHYIAWYRERGARS